MLEHTPHFVGEALKGVRPGVEKTLSHHDGIESAPVILSVRLEGLDDGAPMDVRHTQDGEGRSPVLRWSGSPDSAVATVIVVEDADSPTPVPLVHLLAWREAGDGTAPEGAWGPSSGDDRMGHNSFRKIGWLPPDPPPGHGPHRYVFQVFAVDAWPDFTGKTVEKSDVLRALEGHVLARGSAIATYERA
ncbi:YbhB/YbcL family Raf kinase inhibitor-like protein [soil metagenome]